MGGILGGIFGGGQRTSATSKPDAISQDFNRTRMQQYNDLLANNGGIGQFAQQGGSAYLPTQRSNMLFDQANQAYADTNGVGNVTPFNMDYNMNYNANDMNTNFGAGDMDMAYNTDYGVGDINNRFNTNYGADQVNSNFNTNLGAGNISNNYNTNYAPTVQGLQNPNNQLMSLDDFRKETTDTTNNYINRIASPQIKAAMAAQGMEGSGALPEAIANATAQYGGQFVSQMPGVAQQNANVRLGEASNARSNAQAAMQAQQLGNQAVDQYNQAQMQRGQLMQMGNQAQQMGNEAVGQRANIYGMQNQAQQMGNEATLQRGNLYGMQNQARGMQNQAVLGRGQLYGMENQARLNRGQLMGMENDARTAFNNAAAQQSMLPEQMRNLRAQTGMIGAQRANTLFNMSDQERALQEQDLMRRQGVAMGAYSGMPYNPGTFQSGRQSQQPLFNWFGQG